MRSCNNCGVHRCSRFNKKNDPVAICPKYTPMIPAKVKFKDLISKVHGDLTSPVLVYFRRWV